MKSLVIGILVVLGLLLAVFRLSMQPERVTSAVAENVNASINSAVVVELFTSEGCSSCPPADRLLRQLKEGSDGNAKVITLAYHVDYWDYLGWKDRFSSAEFSKRQEKYASRFGLNSTYTPQMVVNGTREFVGSDRTKAADAIANEASRSSGKIDLHVDSGKLAVEVSGISAKSNATVYLAVAESGLVNKVRRGENSGSTLEHVSVVRRLIPLGQVKPGEDRFIRKTDLPQNPDWNSENIEYVVFVQDEARLSILAAGVAK